MDPERKAFISSLLEHYQPKDAQDIQDMLKNLLGKTLQGMLNIAIFLLRAIKKSSWIDIYFNINPRGYIALLEFTQN